MTDQQTQKRWLNSITISEKPDKSLYQCHCNCPADCRICPTLITDSQFLSNTQLQDGRCQCSFGDCFCVLHHAILYLEPGTPVGTAVTLCGSDAVTLAEEDFRAKPGHSISTLNSRIDCPDCRRRMKQYRSTGDAWRFPRLPDLNDATPSELQIWQDWTQELLNILSERQKAIDSQPLP